MSQQKSSHHHTGVGQFIFHEDFELIDVLVGQTWAVFIIRVITEPNKS